MGFKKYGLIEIIFVKMYMVIYSFELYYFLYCFFKCVFRGNL